MNELREPKPSGAALSRRRGQAMRSFDVTRRALQTVQVPFARARAQTA